MCYRPWFWGTLPKYRSVISLRDVDNQGLLTALCGKILLDTLPQHRGVYTDNVVCGSVIVNGPPEDLPSHFLLVDVLDAFLENAITQIEKHFTKPCRLAYVAAGNNPLHQQPAAVFNLYLDRISAPHFLFQTI